MVHSLLQIINTFLLVVYNYISFIYYYVYLKKSISKCKVQI
jgi:hypothetical protein